MVFWKMTERLGGELVQDDAEKLIEDSADQEVWLSADGTSIEIDPFAWIVDVLMLAEMNVWFSPRSSLRASRHRDSPFVDRAGLGSMPCE